MAFGKRKNTQADDSETHISETQDYIDLDDDEVQQRVASKASQTSGSGKSKTKKPSEEKDQNKPLIDEVSFNGAGDSKNPGGNKQWTCNHCKDKYTSSYTRIHSHFFGPAVGKKADIKRCPTILKDRALFERLFKKVKEAESCGVSKSLKNSVLLKNASSSKRIDESFGLLERNAVDLKILRGLCANGIPFNVLRNPQFLEMIDAIKHAPDSYKPPSFEKARTVLLDECVRDVEKALTPIKDTWYTQGVSIVSDGWSNVKHNPLINVLAVNSRGAMFMYSDDFLGVKKEGQVIAKFLLGAIDTIGPSNVLQVVTDNAANCKAAGKEIEKVYKHIFWSPCCVHTLNLVFKDLAKEFYWLSDTYKRGKGIVKYFLNHTHALSFFRENSNLENHTHESRFYDRNYLERLAPGGVEREAPNNDKEVVLGVMEAFERIEENKDEQRILREKFATFHMKKGIYSKSATQADAVTMDPIDWWASYGSETPELAEIAKKVLSQPISSSSAERNWSTYSYIHNVKRNRLNCKRADKLVFVHSNIRLQSRFSDSYKSGPHKKWDMNPENAYIEGSSARLKEMTWEDLVDEGVENGKGKRQRVD